MNSMKFLKTMVNKLSTRTTQVGDMTLFEVLNDGKVVASLGMSGPTSMMVWKGKATNRKGLLKTTDRTTQWNQAGFQWNVECDRLLFNVTATMLAEYAQGMF